LLAQNAQLRELGASLTHPLNGEKQSGQIEQTARQPRHPR